ncbi:MAG: hypothetical protein LBM65_02025 [Oscillospiraceae bacterium]|jgi:hypothetical protein|nr:hypothetical protein [Oscillospiraceae bacterium]
MDIRIKNNDIYTDSIGNTVYVNGLEELLQKIALRCKAEVGEYVLNPELGVFTDDITLKSSDTLQGTYKLFSKALNCAIAVFSNVKLRVKGHDFTTGEPNLTCDIYVDGIWRKSEVIYLGNS